MRKPRFSIFLAMLVAFMVVPSMVIGGTPTGYGDKGGISAPTDAAVTADIAIEKTAKEGQTQHLDAAVKLPEAAISKGEGARHVNGVGLVADLHTASHTSKAYAADLHVDPGRPGSC